MLSRLLAVLAVMIAVSSSAMSVASDDPNAVVIEAAELLAEKLDGRREELAIDSAALYAIIDEILLPRFDRRFAAQLVLAKHWRSASPEQRDRFINGFYQAMLRRYSDGVLEFEQERVKVLPFRGDTSKRRAKVRTTVVLNDGTSAAVDYELVRRDAGWLVFNVIIEGVSYVRSYRAELDAEIRAGSVDAVIERLEREAGIGNDV